MIEYENHTQMVIEIQDSRVESHLCKAILVFVHPISDRALIPRFKMSHGTRNHTELEIVFLGSKGQSAPRKVQLVSCHPDFAAEVSRASVLVSCSER